jgi:hypothetical protein
MIAIHIDKETRFVHVRRYALEEEFESTPNIGSTHYRILKSKTLSNTFLHYYCGFYLSWLLDGQTIVLDQAMINEKDLEYLRQKRWKFLEMGLDYVANYAFKSNETVVMEHDGLAFVVRDLAVAKRILAQNKLSKLLQSIRPLFKLGKNACYLESYSTAPIEQSFQYERRLFEKAGYTVTFTRLDSCVVKMEYNVI